MGRNSGRGSRALRGFPTISTTKRTSQDVRDSLNRDFPDDSSHPPKTVARSSINRKRAHSCRFGGLGWATQGRIGAFRPSFPYGSRCESHEPIKHVIVVFVPLFRPLRAYIQKRDGAPSSAPTPPSRLRMTATLTANRGADSPT